MRSFSVFKSKKPLTLQEYIKSKKDEKPQTTTNLAKLKLAELLNFELHLAGKDIIEKQKITYIISKMNDVMENPTKYSTILIPKVFTTKNYDEYVKSCKRIDSEICAENAIKELYDYFKKTYAHLELPTELPEHVKTSSGWGYSIFHDIMKSLYAGFSKQLAEQCSSVPCEEAEWMLVIR